MFIIIAFVLFSGIVCAADGEIKSTLFKGNNTQLSNDRQLLLRILSLPIDIQRIIVAYLRHETEDEFRTKLKKALLPIITYESQEQTAGVRYRRFSIYNSPDRGFYTTNEGELKSYVKEKSWYGRFMRMFDLPNVLYQKQEDDRWHGVVSIGFSPSHKNIAFRTRWVMRHNTGTFLSGEGYIGISHIDSENNVHTQLISITDEVAKRFLDRKELSLDEFLQKKQQYKTEHYFLRGQTEDTCCIEKRIRGFLGISNDGKKVAFEVDKQIAVLPIDSPQDVHIIDDANLKNLPGYNNDNAGYLYFSQYNEWLGRIALPSKDKPRFIAIYSLPYEPTKMTLPEHFANISVCKDLMTQVNSWVA